MAHFPRIIRSEDHEHLTYKNRVSCQHLYIILVSVSHSEPRKERFRGLIISSPDAKFIYTNRAGSEMRPHASRGWSVYGLSYTVQARARGTAGLRSAMSEKGIIVRVPLSATICIPRTFSM